MLFSVKISSPISSVKTEKIIKPVQRKNIYIYIYIYIYILCPFWLYMVIYTGLGYFIWTRNINWIHIVWVDLINEGQQETHGLLGKKANSMEKTYYGGNECIPKITITWIQLNYFRLWIYCGGIKPSDFLNYH